MAGDFKSVRVVANTNNKNLRTVNIVTAANPKFKKKLQVTAAVAAANPGKFQTVQDSGGTIAGLKTIQILGYSGPN